MNAIFPLLQGPEIPQGWTFLPALIVGIFFGFVLERSGFGNAKILASQFYLYNMRVFKVMFTAIITALTGLVFFRATGLLDFNALFIPDTYYLPHLVGGFVLGLGFILAGYCPGTSIVALASGKKDAAMTLFGVFLGSFLFGVFYPLIKGFHNSTHKGVFLLSDLFGIPFEVMGLIIIVVALIMYFPAEKVEAIFSKKLNKKKEASLNKKAAFSLATLPLFAVIGIFVSSMGGAVEKGNEPRLLKFITPEKLAEKIIEDPRGFYLVDLRAKKLCTSKQTIPFSICFDDIKNDFKFMYEKKPLIVYDTNDVKPESLPKEVYDFKGEIFALKGGYTAFKNTILNKKYVASIKDVKKANYYSALNAYFTGSKVKVKKTKKVKPKIKRQKIKKTGGCS